MISATVRVGLPALMALAFFACESPLLAGGSSSTETGKKIEVNGRVVATGGQPVAGVVVQLVLDGASDTTDSEGLYLITGEVEKERQGIPDTLRFTLQGQSMGLQVLESLRETLPPLQVVQRGFMGYLKPHGHAVTRIEGVLTGDGILAGDSVTGTFFHNVAAGNYSGFLYFAPPGDSPRTYAVRVNIYGLNDTLLATSASVPFTSQAGNILIPTIEL
jgi:hypothetical protein